MKTTSERGTSMNAVTTHGAARVASRHATTLQERASRSLRNYLDARRRFADARDRYAQAKKELRAATRTQRAADRRAGITPVDAFGQRKPRLRGWQHLLIFPLCVAASIVLICIAPPGPVTAASAVYGASAVLLFGNSALLHVVPWKSRRITRLLCGIDYSNIFLIISGTNTPILFAMRPSIRWPYLTVIWSAALVGTILHVVWLRAPGWVFTIVYVVLGLAPVTLMPLFWTNPYVGPAPTVLIACGGAAYIAGAVCFAIHKPNPVPGWFEFHEVFHSGTIVGYVCHAVAVYLIVCAL